MSPEPFDSSIMRDTLAKIAQVSSEIRWFGDPVLRQTTTPFTHDEISGLEVKEVVNKLIRVLKHTRKHLGRGRALAAPQIGISRRVFVMLDTNTDIFNVYTNPVISSKSKEQGRYIEMCLSGLLLAGEVIRPWEIEFEYYDEEGKYHKTIADPMFSRVVQHEIDHLDGILFVDYVDPKTLSFEFDSSALKTRNRLEKIG